MYEYKDIPMNKLHSGVKEAVKDFHKLPQRQKERRPLLYHVLQSGTPEWKMSKEDSQYADISPAEGQYCGNCRFAYEKVVQPGRYICSKIRGTIQPEGWCKLWIGGE